MTKSRHCTPDSVTATEQLLCSDGSALDQVRALHSGEEWCPLQNMSDFLAELLKIYAELISCGSIITGFPRKEYIVESE